MKYRIALGLIALTTAFHSLVADTVRTNDGSELKGNIVKITEGVLYLDTSYAGTLEIQQKEIAGIKTDSDFSVRLVDGTQMKGAVADTEAGLAVKTDQASMNMPVEAIQVGWAASEEDPVEIARREAVTAANRAWTFKVGVNISGKSGNTDKSDTEINASAQLKGQKDTLKLYTKITKGESEGETTDDEVIAGVKYDTRFTDHVGWYVRTEGETDDFEDIEFRSTNAAGLSYQFYDTDIFTLDSRLGLAYRYESYLNDTSDEFPGIDIGFSLNWEMSSWASLNSDFTYLPSFDDFGDFILKQDTGVEMPLGISNRWILRIGVANDYNSEPELGKDEMDTSYYARLILKWD